MTCECSVFQVALAQREKRQKGAVSSAPAGQSSTLDQGKCDDCILPKTNGLPP